MLSPRPLLLPTCPLPCSPREGWAPSCSYVVPVEHPFSWWQLTSTKGLNQSDSFFLFAGLGKRICLPRRRGRRWGLIPGLGRSPGGGNDNPPQYSCLKNPMDRGVWWVTKGWNKPDMTEKLRIQAQLNSKAFLPVILEAT